MGIRRSAWEFGEVQNTLKYFTFNFDSSDKKFRAKLFFYIIIHKIDELKELYACFQTWIDLLLY